MLQELIFSSKIEVLHRLHSVAISARGKVFHRILLCLARNSLFFLLLLLKSQHHGGISQILKERGRSNPSNVCFGLCTTYSARVGRRRPVKSLLRLCFHMGALGSTDRTEKRRRRAPVSSSSSSSSSPSSSSSSTGGALSGG